MTSIYDPYRMVSKTFTGVVDPYKMVAAYEQQLLRRNALAQQQANRASLLRREQSNRTISQGVINATIIL